MIKNVLEKLKSIKLFRSFRVRIFLVLLIVGIVPSLVIHSAILSSYEDRAVSVRESEVQNQLKIIAKWDSIYTSIFRLEGFPYDKSRYESQS